MNKLLYLTIPVEEGLPEEAGWYHCGYLADLEDFFWFENGRFYRNRKYEPAINWWQKKVSREEYDKALIQKLIPSFKPISINEGGSVMFLYQPVKQS